MKGLITSLMVLLFAGIGMSAQSTGDIVVTRRLEVSEPMLEARAVYLRAEDVDTFCDISINGHYIGSTSNRFRRWEWDVKEYLHVGENVLEGVFHDAEAVSEKPQAHLPRRMGLGPQVYVYRLCRAR